VQQVEEIGRLERGGMDPIQFWMESEQNEAKLKATHMYKYDEHFI
jgi:hypothetical protein